MNGRHLSEGWSTTSRSKRLDESLVKRGLAADLKEARALILAGKARLSGSLAGRRLTAGTPVPEDADVRVREAPEFVSRGGRKLAHALAAFGLDVSGKVGLDVGASTGGFTDCLLKAGARRVYAVDVGRGQLDWRLRRDARVVVMEGVNARYPFALPEDVDFAVLDVSFISLRLVLSRAFEHLAAGGFAVALVKPQFEARRGEVGKGGVVRDPQVRAAVLGRFIAWAVASRVRLRNLVSSPIAGASGNREFLALLEPAANRPRSR